jgi:3-hydroxyacyl-CoA dehydrogenase/enoyl-CoA hydratase/3-hydroxybutyryl-CoA epimerase
MTATTGTGYVQTAGALSTEIEDGVAIITFDLPNEPINKFTQAVKDEFAATFEKLSRDSRVNGIVLISGKPEIFIAGADIEEFTRLKTAEEAERLSRDGQLMLLALEKSRAPIVAAIHGACLGGGLEAALACAYRIATDHPKTQLGLPETQLGLIPGAGGTQRLPRTVGLRNALPMILTGNPVRAKKALQTGLIDELVHPSILRQIAVTRARELAAGTVKRSRGASHGAVDVVLEDNPLGRRMVFSKARKDTLEKTHGNYPAQMAAIDVIESGYAHGVERGYNEEAKRFGELAMTEVSKQLIGIFFATTALKKDPGIDRPISEPPRVEKIAVIGSGFMGAGIAAIAAQQGTVVRLKDAELPRIAKGLKGVYDILADSYRKKRITRHQLADQMSLVGGTVDYSGFANVDIAIEAVFEDLAVKHDVLRETEAVTHPTAIFASNTSTIPITRIAEASARPERVIGMHFFSPVQKMPLLEVIRGERTSDETVAEVVAYGKRLGKTVIVVHDAPGFYANRILSPYVNEAGRLLDEGASVDAVDRALVNFGFPVGPITLIDEVGLDIAGHSGQVMYEALGERLAPAKSIRSVIDDKRLGRKGKKGFYLYDEAGKKGGVDESVYALYSAGSARVEIPESEIQERCVLAMVNEAAMCFEQGIIRSPRDGDIGAVFGIGFPPFRGGPFRYIDSVGADVITEKLDALYRRFSPRFAPAEVLVRMARGRERFYPRG